ncbi:MAG: GTPase [Nostoc sp. DcaGUA01]|nr:GTPase [Nostoc sp. DcaGUA01]
MSKTALQNLKFLFKDRPDVLRMLDLRELNLAGLESEVLIREQKNRKLFPEPVNFYATGRTGSGKTSLGNSLLDSGKTPMESHGHQDCTSSVQYFALTSNLRYFDLPGAGSDEDFENINRAALLIEQLQDPDITLINKFKLLDFSQYLNEGVKEETITVEQWQSDANQKYVSPDIILYVVAPHMLFIRGDKLYLRALLKSLKERSSSNKVIFALNIHRKDGTQIPTRENIEDARKNITEIYQKFYPGEIPLIVEIDSLKGIGISQVTDFMCRILPPNKIGNMQQVLRGELKEFAKKERSRRYRQALIYIASRLATYTVDIKIGRGVVEEAYAAVCDYGIRIFREEEACFEITRDLYEMVGNFAAEAKISREEAVKIIVSDVEEKEVTENVIKGYTPEYENVEVTYPVEVPSEVETGGNVAGRIGGAFIGGLTGLGAFTGGVVAVLAAGATITTGGLAAPLAASVIGGMVTGGAIGGRKRKKDATSEPMKFVTKMEQRLVGMKEQREEVTKKVPYIVQKEQEVGKKYLQGGYPVVENLLAIGLGIENAQPSQDLQADFEDIVQAGKDQVQAMLSRYKQEINQLAESSSTPEKAQQAEEQIIKILKQAVMN